MERVYFLLIGEGPETEAIAWDQEERKKVVKAWTVFAHKYGGDDWEYLHDNTFLGIKFIKGPCSVEECIKAAPAGWIPVKKNRSVFRPKKTECPEAYAEWRALPRLPFGDEWGKRLGADVVFKANRVLWMGYEFAGKGRIIISSPINDKGEFYVPKGRHEELTASRYLELSKKVNQGKPKGDDDAGNQAELHHSKRA